MGFLDKIMDAAGSIMGDDDDSDKKSMLGGITDLFQGGGLKDVVENFTNNGLGDTISSWIGGGDNMPISTDQIKEGFGIERIQELARKVGISEDKASNLLKDFLPGIIDKVTPGGEIDDDE